MDVKPDTLNHNSGSDKNWVTVYIEFPKGYDVNLIDVSTVSLSVCGAVYSAQASPTEVIDYDGDGVLERMVKFDRQAIIDALGTMTGDITVTVSGKLKDDKGFVGSDVVRVISPGKRKEKE